MFNPMKTAAGARSERFARGKHDGQDYDTGSAPAVPGGSLQG